MTKVSILQPKTEAHWKTGERTFNYSSFNLSANSYTFDKDSLSLAIFPSPKPGINILVGPVLVPLIPNFYAPFIKPDEKFFVDIRIANNELHVLAQDLSKITFRQKETTLQPQSITSIQIKNFGKWDNKDSLEQNLNERIISVNPSDTLVFRFHFNEPTVKVKSLIISFGEADIPNIELKTKLKFVYRPLYDQ